MENSPNKQLLETYDKEMLLREAEKLKDRFGQKSFTKANSLWKNICYYGSFVLLAFGGLSAFYGIYSLFNFILPFPELSMFFAALILFILAMAQRESSDRFWDTYHQTKKAPYQWLAISFCIACLGAAGSVIGIQEGTKVMAGDPDLIIQDSTTILLKQNLESMATDKEAAKGTRWKGTITRDAMRTMNQLSETQHMLIAGLFQNKNKLDQKNQLIEKDHQSELSRIIYILLIILFLNELLFESAMSFCSYCDYRKYCEMIDINPSLFNPEEMHDFTHKLVQNQPIKNGHKLNGNVPGGHSLKKV